MEKERRLTLRYGQIIRIHGNSQEWKGLLMAKGYTDSNTYYMTYENFQHINNYRESLFQILPRGAFDIHDEYIKSNQAQKEVLAPRMRAEADQYDIIIQKRFNDEILFGAEVIFKHIDSEEYLFGSYQCSDFSTDAFKVQLVKLLSSSTVFQILPYQTFQQEGHPVFIDEPVVLCHVKSQCKLDFIRHPRVFIDQHIEFEVLGSSYETLRPCIKKPNREKNSRYEAVVNHNCFTNWVLKLHENYDEAKDRAQRIEPFDLVVFSYTQNRSFLSVDSENSRVILKEQKDNDTLFSLDAVWEIQPIDLQSSTDRFPEIPMRARNVTMTSDHNTRVGGGRNSIIPIGYHTNQIEKTHKITQKYLIRHYLSGKVLTVKSIIERGRQTQIVDVSDYDPQTFDDQAVELLMAKKGFDDMVQNAYVKICLGPKNLQLYTETKKEQSKGVLRRNSSFTNLEMLFKSLNEEDLDYYKHLVRFTDLESLHAFQLQKLDEEQKKDLLFIISSQEILLQFADILKQPAENVELLLNDKILAVVQDVLRSILAYVMNLTDKADAEKSEAIPLKKRQMYLKDLQMIEVIMEIIFFISYNNGIENLFKKCKSEREKLKNIYKLSFKFIEKLTKRNPQIKLHVSQWLELFLNQAMEIDDPQVQSSLSELLDDNYQAINQFIKKTTLKRMIDFLKTKVPHEKYLRILSSICICNGKSIINNQINTIDMFFKVIQPEFRFQFKKEDGGVQVLCHIGKKDLKWRTLKQFYDDSITMDDSQSWTYFLSYFNLLADVGMNRNKFAKQYVEENFSLDILCSVLEDPDCMETNAIEPFLKLIHFSYVDSQHYTPIRQIARVREWHTIETKNDILRTHAEAHLKPENCDLKRVMDFIERYLDDFQYFTVSKRDDNQNLYTILQVLKTTIRLGFWKSVTNLQNILPNLFKICSCNKDFENYVEVGGEQLDKVQHFKRSKDKLTKMNLENLIVMKCKMLSCEIMDIIFDMETNVRVSKATQILKKMINASDSTNKEEQVQPTMKQSTQNMLSTFKKTGNTLKVLQEKQQTQKRNSFLFKLLEPSTDEAVVPKQVQPPESTTAIQNLKNMQIFRKMESKFRKNQEHTKDHNLYDVSTWILHLEELIRDRSLLVKFPRDKYFLEVLFAELSLFDNPQMLEHSLSLLNRIYGQRRELLQNFDKIIIVFQGFTYTLSVESRVTRTKLLALNDRNILSVTEENQKDYNVSLWRESENAKETGIIQDLYYLVQCQKRGEVKRSALKIEKHELYPENGLLAIFTERELNHKLHQSLLKWQDLHESIFPFLFISLDIDKERTLLMKCLHSCYNFLTMLIWNHLDNKIDFQRSFPIQKLFVHTQYNIGCIDFFREMFTNNKALLYSEKQVLDITFTVVKYCNQYNIGHYYKSKLFDFLRVLTVFNDKPIKNNQIILMSKLQEQPDNIMFLLKIDKNTQQQEFSKQTRRRFKRGERPQMGNKGNLWVEEYYLYWVEEYQIQYEQCFTTKVLNIPAELVFMTTFFQTFACLIEDRNEINIGKCMNMHPYPALLNIYRSAQSCWPLKRYLRSYINRLYYMQSDYEEMSQPIIEDDFENIIKDLQDLIDLKIYFHVQQVDKIKINNPVRYSYLSSYTYLCLEECLISLNLFLTNQKFLDDLEDHLNQNFSVQKFKTHLQLLQIGGQLMQVKKLWNHCKFIGQFSRILMNSFRNVFKIFDLSLLVLRESLYISNSHVQMHQVTEIIEIERVVQENQGAKIRSYYSFSESNTDPAKTLNSDLKALVETEDSFDSKTTLNDYINQGDNLESLKNKLIERVFTQAEEYLKILMANSISKEEKVHQNLKKMFNVKSENEKEDINETLNKKHRKLMNTLNLDEGFNKYVEEEFIQVCEQLNRIDHESMRIYGTHFHVIKLEEFITNIIRLNINNPHCLKDDLRIFFLKVLGRIITEKNLKDRSELSQIDAWAPSDWSKYKVQIRDAQLMLMRCGAAELICQLLKEPNLELRNALTNQLLIFGISFLLGGNPDCQKAILTRMKADQNNVMLQNYAIMIRKIGRVIYNNYKIRKDKKGNQPEKFQVIYTDNYDLYDEKLDMMQRYHQVENDDAKETAFKKQCVDIMCRSFRMLQLLCENNNVDMKNFIRQQTDQTNAIKLNTINFIEFTTAQLRIFFKIMNKHLTSIANFMLDFVTEITQLPCLDNQLTLCKTTFFEDSCYMSQFFHQKTNQMDRLFELPEDIVNLQELYNKVIMTAMSVLEGNDESIYEEIQNKLEPRFLIEIIKQNLEALGVTNLKELKRLLELQDEIFSEEIVKILNVLVIKQKVSKHSDDQNSKWVLDMNEKIKNSPGLEEIVLELQGKIRHIEIVYQGNKQLIFFPSHPLFYFLSEQTKDKIMYSINRETQREKILGLLDTQMLIFNEIEYNHKLNQMTIPVTHKTIHYIRAIAATFSILVNFFMIVFYNVNVKHLGATFVAEYHEEVILTMLSLLQLTFSTALFVVYLINRAPLALKLKDKSPEDEEEEEDEEAEQTAPQEMSPEMASLIEFKDKFLEIVKVMRVQGVDKVNSKELGRAFYKFSRTAVGPYTVKLYKKLYQLLGNLYYLSLNEEDFIQFFLYWIFSFLGTFVKNYFFSLHLFDLFSRLSLLKNVFQAISYNAKQLFVVAMLGVLFVFVFSFTSFDTYVDDIYQDEQPEDTCTTLIQCMITLTTSGVIGTSMAKWDPLKFFLDTLYFVFFALLFTNIVSGIMIDTFAELRDQRQKIEDDKKNSCFICGVDRQTLEKQNEEFEMHIKHKHQLWNYLFYIYGLIKKDSTEYTGLEYAIRDMLKKEEISWFPMISQDNTSILENFDQMMRNMDDLKRDVETMTMNCVEEIKGLLNEKFPDDKEKKK